jgi:3-hydroxyisobutyrate dehydrogenase-like beta-hydroxyacid dehydrogenase
MLPYEKLTSNSRLGFIGLGHLGSPIARRLIAAGFPMVVYDRDSERAADLIRLDANVSSHPRTLASEVDVVLSCLPNESSVEDVYMGTGDVLHSARPGTRIIELSTISPETSRRLHREAHQLGLSALDVAVSGSAPSAEAGTLTLFGGGDPKVFEAVESIFAAIARQWFYMGSSGAGVAMKLVVNTLLGVGMQAIAEAAALGSSLGLPRDLLFETLAKTAVVAPAHIGKLVTAKEYDYTPQFPIRLMRKDFGLILAAAGRFKLPMPATAAASEINSAEAASGMEEDFSAVIRRMALSTLVEQAVPPAA